LDQVTVVPAFMVTVAGVKVKLSMDMAVVAFCALATIMPPARPVPITAPSMAAATALRIMFVLLNRPAAYR
jgi:hypothetical protein